VGGLGRFIAAGVLAAWLPGAWAQAGIYTCVDSKGRRLTSDRPIIDCLDREQTELSPSGKVVRKLGPSMTAEERAADEERQRKALEEKLRIEDEKRRDRALLSRFPDKATHDKEREIALGVVDEVIKAATRRVSELQWQRKGLDGEMEFYKGDTKQVPEHLKRQVAENQNQLEAQKRFIGTQEEEKKRINQRFDDDLVRLHPLWAKKQGLPVTAAVPASAAKAASASRPASAPKKK
jgi:hypothetical protein